MARVLLSGFEPFGVFKRNPSWDALKLAKERGLFPESPVELVEIPVTYAGAFKVLEQAVRNFRPEVIVCFGVHGSGERTTLYLERVARNRNENKVDNVGAKRPGAIVEGEPESLKSEYPVEDLRDPLIQAGFKAEFSDNAGGYLCNNLYFRSCHAFKGRVPVAFVHVPPAEGEGALPLEKLAEAVAIVAKHAAFLGSLKKK